MSVRLRPGVLIDDAQLSIANACHSGNINITGERAVKRAKRSLHATTKVYTAKSRHFTVVYRGQYVFRYTRIHPGSGRPGDPAASASRVCLVAPPAGAGPTAPPAHADAPWRSAPRRASRPCVPVCRRAPEPGRPVSAVACARRVAVLGYPGCHAAALPEKSPAPVDAASGARPDRDRRAGRPGGPPTMRRRVSRSRVTPAAAHDRSQPDGISWARADRARPSGLSIAMDRTSVGSSGPGRRTSRDGGRDARAGGGRTRPRLAAAAAGATEQKG